MSDATWVLRDTSRGTERELESRSEAEDAKQDLLGIGADASDLEIIPPGGENAESDGGGELMGVDRCVHCDQEIEDGWCPDCDGDDETDTPAQSINAVESTDGDVSQAVVDADDPADLPDRSVGDDPLTWMPQHFVDEIDGTPAINRKGFEVLAHHYGISTTSDLEVAPEENGHEYVRVKARAVTEDGRECEAYGSAHVDRGDDPELLLEMADTRARKRALSVATGVGVVAVSELQNEMEQ